METPRNLYEQMSDTDRHTLALLLGFATDENCAKAPGFLCNLRDIPPLPAPFTYGEALRAYCDHLTK